MDQQSPRSVEVSPKCAAWVLVRAAHKQLLTRTGLGRAHYRCEHCGYVWDDTALHEEDARVLWKLPHEID